jgi:hypothetical protein
MSDLYLYLFKDFESGGVAASRYQVGFGSWEMFSHVFGQSQTTDDGAEIIYGVAGGDLRWYKHSDWKTGGRTFDVKIVGFGGWDSFQTVFSGEANGVFYGVTKDGNLVWYRHIDWQTGGPNFAKKTVGFGGWNAFKTVLSGGAGIIYAVTPEGDLLWYKHTDWQTGGTNFERKTVGFGGWNAFSAVFSGGAGIIYTVTPEGDLLWYKHTDWQTGGTNFERKTVGRGGWNAFSAVFNGGPSAIYAVAAAAPLHDPTHDRGCWVNYPVTNPDGSFGGYDTFWEDRCPYAREDGKFKAC